jgi:hypothetical protein
LQTMVEGITKNLAIDDAEARDDGFRDHNIVAMIGGALAAELGEEEGFQIGIISLQLKC